MDACQEMRGKTVACCLLARRRYHRTMILKGNVLSNQCNSDDDNDDDESVVNARLVEGTTVRFLLFKLSLSFSLSTTTFKTIMIWDFSSSKTMMI